jgi:hypothetical protein
LKGEAAGAADTHRRPLVEDQRVFIYKQVGRMGPAHSTVVNMSSKRICVITFLNTDLLYFSKNNSFYSYSSGMCNFGPVAAYTAMYVIESLGSAEVQAQPDAIGLKVGLVYDINEETSELHYLRFQCLNDSVLSILDVDFDEISWYGGESMICGR